MCDSSVLYEAVTEAEILGEQKLRKGQQRAAWVGTVLEGLILLKRRKITVTTSTVTAFLVRLP